MTTNKETTKHETITSTPASGLFMWLDENNICTGPEKTPRQEKVLDGAKTGA